MQKNQKWILSAAFLIGCSHTQTPRSSQRLEKIIHSDQISLYGDDGEPNFCANNRMSINPASGLCTLKEEFVPPICKDEPIRQPDVKDYCIKIRAGFPTCPFGGPYNDKCVQHPIDPGPL